MDIGIKITPRANRVLVGYRIPETTSTKGGLIIADKSKNDSVKEGEVLMIGSSKDGAFDDLTVGARVLFIEDFRDRIIVSDKNIILYLLESKSILGIGELN